MMSMQSFLTVMLMRFVSVTASKSVTVRASRGIWNIANVLKVLYDLNIIFCLSLRR